MQENEFEKQVRKLLDEFRLSPSDSVWEKVKARIAQRRRKWPLVLLLLVSMLGAAYLLYDGFRKPGITQGNLKPGNTSEKVQQKGGNSKLQNDDSLFTGQPGAEIKTVTSKQKMSGGVVISLAHPVPNPSYAKPLNQTETIGDTGFVSSGTPMIDENQNKADNKKALIATANSNDTSKQELTNIVQPNPNTTNEPVSENTNAVTPSNEKEHLSKNANIKKLSFGITLYGGSGNTVDNLPGIDLSKSMDAVNAIFDTAIASGNYPDKAFTSSYSFKAGGFVQKNFSQKSAVSIDISYMLFTNKAEITYPNVAPPLAVSGPGGVEYINNYYRPGTGEQLVNKYHFLEFGAGFHQSLTGGRKMQLYLDAGLSLLQLISANTLIYDENNNTYYHKNEWLSKTQGAFNSGLSLHIKINNTNSLFVGPAMNYGFTNLLKNKNYNPQHLFNYGLKVGWMIGQK